MRQRQDVRSESSWTHVQGRAERGGNVLSTPAEFSIPEHWPGDHDLSVLRTVRAFSGAPTGACIEFFPMQMVAGPASSRPINPRSEAREMVVAPAPGTQGRRHCGPSLLSTAIHPETRDPLRPETASAVPTC